MTLEELSQVESDHKKLAQMNTIEITGDFELKEKMRSDSNIKTASAKRLKAQLLAVR